MLSIATIKSASDAAHYYEKDDYYTKDDPEHKKYSEWYGKGAENLGLSGQVDKSQFLRLLEGKLPNGTRLGRREGEKIIHACGIDLTFSAPKSASILSELKGDKRVREAHEKAVKTVVTYIEKKGLVKIRNKVNGEIIKEKVHNLLVSFYRHNTSRAGDPQMHDHTVLQNMAIDKSGKWRSVDFKELFENKMLLGLMYRVEYAYALTKTGYTIDQKDKGTFEIAGVPQEVIDLFSKRSNTIKEALKEYDFKNAKTKALIAKVTRESKKGINRQEFYKWWSEQCQSTKAEFLKEGIEKIQESGRIDQAKVEEPRKENTDTLSCYLQEKWEEFCGVFESNPNKEVERVEEDKESKLPMEEQAIMYAIKHLTERSAVFTEKALEYNALESGLGKLDVEKILSAKEKLIENKVLLPSKLKEFEATFTTKDALKQEKETIELLKDGFKTQKSLYTKAEIQKHLKKTTLNPGQKEAVSLILNTKDRVIGIQGHAGTGKTYMLNEARKLLKKKGYECIGVASSSSATSVLQKDAKIKSKTVHKFLAQYKEALTGKLTLERKQEMQEALKGKVLILDEASLVSTAQINGLLKVSKKLDVKLVTTGDGKQMGAVEAGKPFVQMQKAGMGTATMDDIKRQTNKVLRGAVYDASYAVDTKDAPHIRRAFEKIGNNYHEVKTEEKGNKELAQEKTLQGLVKKGAAMYLASSRRIRKDTLIVTPSHDIRNATNQIIVKGLRQEGALTGKQEDFTTLRAKNLTEAEKTRAHNYAKGDQVLFYRNYQFLGVKRGQYYTVEQTNGYNKVKLQGITDSKATCWIDPSKVAGNRKGALEVFTVEQDTIGLQKGAVLRWTKNSHIHREIKNSESAHIQEVTDKHLKVKLACGTTKMLRKDDTVFKHMSFAYCSTVHASQGKGAKYIIGIIESDHKHLTNQRLFYVELSRGKEKVYLISDNLEKLIETLNKTTGAKLSSLEHQGDLPLDKGNALSYLKNDTAVNPRWSKTVQDVIKQFGEDTYISWFSKLEFDSKQKGTLNLKTKSPLVKEWIETYYGNKFKDIANKHFKNTTKIEVVVDREMKPMNTDVVPDTNIKKQPESKVELTI